MENLSIDKVTGYLENNEELGIKPRHKTAFLKAFKLSGNQCSSASKLGFTWGEMENELGKDLKFMEAYKATLIEMKQELEGILYTKAIDKGDVRSAMMWLQAKFPDEYKPGTKPPAKKNSEALFDNLLGK